MLNNAGTLKKSAGTGTSTINSAWTVNNTGTIEVNTGTLSLQGGGTSTGAFNTAAGSALNFGGGTYILTGCTFSNSGTLNFNATLNFAAAATLPGTVNFNGGTVSFAAAATLPGTVNFNGGTVNFAAATNLPGPANLSGGSLGGGGAATFGNLTWTGGTMTGTGSTEVAAGTTLNITPTSSYVWLARTIDNFGAVTLGGNYNLLGTGGGSTPTINNQPGATLNIQTDIGLANWDSTPAVLNNAGTVMKSGGTGASMVGSTWTFYNAGTVAVETGTLTCNGPFNNSGIAAAQGGTLSFGGGGTSTGTFNAATGCALNFNGGAYTLTGCTFSNAGTLNFSGTANFTTAVTLPGTVNFNGGIVSFNGSASSTVTGPATLGNGSIAGSGAVSFSNLTWTYGTMTGTGSTEVAAGATLNIAPSSPYAWLARTIDNFGTLTLDGNYDLLTLGGGSTPTINNHSGATLDIQTDTGLGNYWDTTPGVLNNAGTLKKSAGTAVSTVGSRWTVNNTGTVEVDAATLCLNGPVAQISGGALTGGTWIIRGNSTLTIATASNLATNEANVTLDGAGSTFSNINSLANNQGSFTITNGGNFTTAAGLSNSGTIQVGAGSTLSINGAAGNLTQTAGGLALADSGAVSARSLIISGGTIAAGGPTATINASLNYTSSASSTFQGIIAGSGNTLTLNSAAATLTLSGSNSYAGGTIIQGGVLQLDGNNSGGGPVAVNAGALSGTGTVAGAVTVNGPAHLAPGDNAGGGTFGGAGLLTLGGLTLNSGANLDMDLGDSSDLVVVNGLLDLEGATLNVQSISAAAAVGSYELISYTGLTGSNLLIGNLPAGCSAVVVNNSSAKEIDLNVCGPITWTGVSSSAWDTDAMNWSGGGGIGPYNDGLVVRFDDTAGTGSVTITGTVQPWSITVNAASLAYVFSGSGSIAGTAALTKSGAGSLEINMGANTYSGGSNLIAGVLQVDASSTVSGGTLQSGPLGTGPLALSGGTLQDDGQGRTLANAVNISGSVALGGVTLGPQGLTAPNAVSLSGAATITVTAPVTIADRVSGNLVMAGPSTLTLTAAANSLTGTTLVSGGTLAGTAANIATPVALANRANVTYNQQTNGTLSQPVSGNGSLTATGDAVLTVTSSNTYTGATTISGGTLQLGDGGTAGSINGSSGVADNGVLAFDEPGSTTFSQSVSGSGSLLQMGSAVLLLMETNTYTGGTTVSDGTLELASPAALPTEGIINVGRSGIVDLTGLLAIPDVVGSDDSRVSMDTAAQPSSTAAGATVPADSKGAPPVVVAAGSGVIEVPPADGFTAVPEPGTLALLLAGAAALAIAGRRRLGRLGR